MSIFTKDKVYISADRKSYIEYSAGSQQFSLVVDGTTILTATAAAGVSFAELGDDVVAKGEPVANITDPTGGSTEDAEARTAINSILNALEAFGIMAAAA